MKIRNITNFGIDDEDESGPTTVGISPDRLEQIKLKMKDGDDNALAELFRSLKDIISVATDIDYLDDLQQSGPKGLLFRRRIEAGAKKAKQVQEDLDKHSEEAVIKDTNKIKNMQTAGKIVAASCEPPLDSLVEAIFNRMAESKIDYIKLQQIHANEKTEGILDDVVAKYPEVNQKLKDEFGDDAVVSDEAIESAKEDSDWEDIDDEDTGSEDEDWDPGSDEDQSAGDDPLDDPEIAKKFEKYMIELDTKNASDVCEGLAKEIFGDDFDQDTFESVWDAALEDNNNDIVATGNAVRAGYLKGYRQHVAAQNKNFGLFNRVAKVRRMAQKLKSKYRFILVYDKKLNKIMAQVRFAPNIEAKMNELMTPGNPSSGPRYVTVWPYDPKGYFVSSDYCIDMNEFDKVYRELAKGDELTSVQELNYYLDTSMSKILYIDVSKGRTSKDHALPIIYEKLNAVIEANDWDMFEEVALEGNEEIEGYKKGKDRGKKSGNKRGKKRGKNFEKISRSDIMVRKQVFDVYRNAIIPINYPTLTSDSKVNVRWISVPTSSSLFKIYQKFVLGKYRGCMLIKYNPDAQMFVAGAYFTALKKKPLSADAPSQKVFSYKTEGFSSITKLGMTAQIIVDVNTGEVIKGAFDKRGHRIGLFSDDIETKAKEYAWTLAQEIFGDEADKSISDKVAENAIKEGDSDEAIMGIIKNSMR